MTTTQNDAHLMTEAQLDAVSGGHDAVSPTPSEARRLKRATRKAARLYSRFKKAEEELTEANQAVNNPGTECWDGPGGGIGM